MSDDVTQQLGGGIAFPPDFFWGAATASHQVEGDNRWNDWWDFEQSGRLPYKSTEACRHYELYESDFDLAQSLGHTAHRFSIEWSRVEPAEGEWDEAALQHYADVVEALRRRGIEPIVTLHHFTNPEWFARRGGWSRSDSIELFARYVEVVAARLSSRVKYWVSVNEPTVLVKHAYITGDWPPCEPGAWWKAAQALRNLCRAHVAAYRLLHQRRSDSMVGLAHSAPYVVPCNTQSPADRAAAWARDFVLNEAVFRLIGRRPRDVLDFIGVNYYTRQVVRWRPSPGGAAVFGTECRADHHGVPRAFSDLGWEIYAPGLRRVLGRFARHGVPLMVTENGIATHDERLRSEHLVSHAKAVSEAISDGVRVLGYIYWTLMDNFEWREGRSACYGLAAVDFSTQERRLRPVARVFRALCERNAIDGASADKDS